LSGNSGGSITSNKTKGQALTGMTIDLGEVGPSNSNSYIKATLPLRLRSNAGYDLAMSASFSNSNTEANAVQASDIGFGLGTPSRTDADVQAGTDTVVPSGDPTLDADVTAGGRHNFAANKALSGYASSTSVLTGDPIMDVIPPDSNTNGLTADAYFAVKPQFFAPGSFTATITFTITAP
jgi:hypothetical protein